MTTTLSMSDSVPQDVQVQHSEEVRDITHLARKLARKSPSGIVQDRHYLLGLLQMTRLFTPADALLRQAGAPPSSLKKVFQEELKRFPAPADEGQAVKMAENLAKSDTHSQSDRKVTVGVEHLLLALLNSQDPLVSAVMKKSALTETRIMDARSTVEAGSVLRIVLYCLREIVEVVVVVIVLLIVIKQGLGELRLIPSESMVPTLQVGDRIVVEKLSHWSRSPKRGDILVFYPPQAILRHDPWSVFLRLTGFSGILYDKESNIDTAYIKRLIALPGDIVEVRPADGVYINGKKLTEPYIAEVANTCTFVSYCGPVRVPENMYYMMGDNRNHSADSRYWQFLPAERVIGRAVFRFFPLDSRLGPLDKPSPAH